MKMNMKTRCAGVAVVLVMCGVTASAAGQSLFVRPVEVQTDESGNPDLDAGLRQVSMMYVQPPKPKTFKRHDQITIIIDENSRASAKQTLDTKKDYSLAAALRDFPNLVALLDGRLEQDGTSGNIAEAGASGNSKFKGEGTYDRTDRFNARITATVIDVKPNGVLVLEARKSIARDEEETTITLTGRARTDDVTTSNTVLSSQLAELSIVSRNEGEVREAGSKGIIPRIFDAIFNF